MCAVRAGPDRPEPPRWLRQVCVPFILTLGPLPTTVGPKNQIDFVGFKGSWPKSWIQARRTSPFVDSFSRPRERLQHKIACRFLGNCPAPCKVRI